MYAQWPMRAGDTLVIWGGRVFTSADIDAGRVAPRSAVAIGEGVYLGHPVGSYDRERDDRGDFINHSCDPNLWMANELTLVARRDIAAGDELTMDYAMIEADEQNVKPWPCRCSSAPCRGRITGQDWHLETLQDAYAGHFSPFINRRIEARRIGVRIRQAHEGDARAIAGVHMRGWQWAYRGQLPDAYLDALSDSIEERTAHWERTLPSRPAEQVWVAEADGQIVGFAATAASRDSDADEQTAEVGAIYLDEDWAGKGVGRVLFAQAVEDLRLLGWKRATLWVLESNERARRFYERADLWPDGGLKVENRPGFELRELRYRLDFARSARPT